MRVIIFLTAIIYLYSFKKKLNLKKIKKKAYSAGILIEYYVSDVIFRNFMANYQVILQNLTSRVVKKGSDYSLLRVPIFLA
jgi:hypothetical protein